MAGIITNVGEDIKSLQQLRQEIENVKKALGSIDINVKIDIRKELEQKLQALTKQYDVLVSKAAEADAKLMESAARIDKSVDTITKAQEKAAKANSQQTGTADKGQTAAVEGQAKAYLDLKNEIDSILGTREQNIRKMMQEQNAIKLINAEIAQINKSRQYGGSLTSTQSQRLQQLNDSLLTHKQALAEVRQELNNNAKLDIAAVGSMNELSQSLSRMRIAYRALNEDERNSEFGQNLLKSIQEADAKIKELDATIGNHQRNVGNYQGSFNGLNMSVQQIVRELPSATMGINMFFLAISNNLPILADQIKLAKEFNKEMRAAGSEPVPVWKQLVSSLFSWQTAMMVGISLLTMYGKDIVNWIKNLGNAKTAISDLVFAQQQLRDAQKEARHEAVSEQTKLKVLYATTQDATLAMRDRLVAVKQMKQQYPSYFSKLSNEAILAGKAAGAYRQLAADILKAAQARAMEKRIEKLADRNIDLERSNNADKNWQKRNSKAYKASVDSHKATDTNGARAFVPTGVDMSGGKRNGQLEQEWSERLERLENHTDELSRNNKAIQQLTNKVAKIKATEINLGFNPKPVKDKDNNEVNEVDYAKLEREQSDAERELEDKVSQSRIDAMQDSYEKEKAQRDLNHKKELDDIEKKRQDFLQKRIDAEKEKFEADPKNKGKKFNSSSVSLTDAETGKFDEMVANVNTKYTNEERQVELARLQSLYDYLKQYGTIQEQMYAIAKEYDEKIASEKDENKKKILEAEKKSALASSNSKNLALDVDWGASFEGVGNVLHDIAKETLGKIEEYMKTAEFKALSPESKKSYTDLRNNLRKDGVGGATSPFNFSIWGKIAEQTRAYQDAVRTLNDKTGEHTNAVEELQRAEDELSKATDETAKSIAQAKVDAAKKKVEETGAAQTDAKASADEAKQNLTDSTNSAAQGIQNFTSAINEMNNGSLYGFTNGITKLVTSLSKGSDGVSKGLSELGGKVGGIIGAILQIIDALGDAPAEFISSLLDKVDTAVQSIVTQLPDIIVDIVKGVVNIVGGIVEGIGSWFGTDDWMNGSNEKEVKETTERLTKSNDSLQKSIDSLKESIDKSNGAKAIDSYDDAYKNQEQVNKNTMEILKAQMGYHGNHHSNAYYWSLGDAEYKQINDTLAKYKRDNPVSKTTTDSVYSLDDIYKLTPEQMKAISVNNVELWSRMLDEGKYDKSEYWENYIALAGELDELTDKISDNLTQTSFDSLHDDFVSTIMDMDATASDFADNFTQMMAKAYTNAAVGDLMDDDIKKFKEKWAAKMDNENGNIEFTKDEIDELRRDYQTLADKALDIRNAMQEATGYTGTDSQNATANGISSITYDQASSIVALTTAGNVSRDQIKDRLTLVNATIDDIKALIESSMVSVPNVSDTRSIINNSYSQHIQVSFPNEELRGIRSDIKALGNIVDEMRTYGVEQLLEQRGISENTSKMVKDGTDIKSYIQDIKKDTKNLR